MLRNYCSLALLNIYLTLCLLFLAQKPVSLLELPVLNNRKSQRPPSIIPHSDPFVTNVRNDSLPGNPAVQRERPMMQNPSILGV